MHSEQGTVATTGHTPGPWEVATQNGRAVANTIRGNGRIVGFAHIEHGPHGEEERHPDHEWQANANLMTAAPDLLTASEAALQAIRLERALNPKFSTAWQHIEAQLDRAIAKAGGAS